MQSRLVHGGGDELSEVIAAFDSDPSIRGIAVLAAEGSLPDPDGLEATLRGLSVPVFGGLFPEVLHAGERTDGVVVAGLSVEPTITVVPGLSDAETRFEDHLPAEVPDGGTAFVLVDAYASRVEDFVSSLFATYGVGLTYLGGGAGSLDMEQRPCLFTNDGIVEDAAVLATVDAPTSIGVRHGWEEIAGPLKVTAADGPTLAELDGEPAFSVYRRVVEDDAGVTLTEDNFFDVAKMYPFGISRLEGEKIVRDPFEVTDDGGLTCFGDVPEGEFLHVLKGEEASLVEAAGEAYAAADPGTGEGPGDEEGPGDVEGATAGEDERDVLFFDCISRVLYLEDEFARELEAVGGRDSPAVGALTIGEIANDGEGHLDYYNKTAVAAVTDGM